MQKPAKKAKVLEHYIHVLKLNSNTPMQLKSTEHHNFQGPLITQNFIINLSCDHVFNDVLVAPGTGISLMQTPFVVEIHSQSKIQLTLSHVHL